MAPFAALLLLQTRLKGGLQHFFRLSHATVGVVPMLLGCFTPVARHNPCMTTKTHILDSLKELRLLMTLEEGSPQAFRVRAYDNAIQGLESTTGDFAAMTDAELVALKGVGRSTAAKIRELIDTGSIKKLDGLREEYPAEFVNLTRIPGLGPKTLLMLRDELSVNNLEDLKSALAGERLRDLPGLGQKARRRSPALSSGLGCTARTRGLRSSKLCRLLDPS